MKNCFTFFMLTIMAANVFGSPIPHFKLKSYKEAVALSLTQNPLSCVDTGGQVFSTKELGNEINWITSGEIEVGGEQPQLVFKYSDYQNRGVARIVTSSDRKTVVSFEYEMQQSRDRRVNQGNIVEPKTVSQANWITVESYKCQ